MKNLLLLLLSILILSSAHGQSIGSPNGVTNLKGTLSLGPTSALQLGINSAVPSYLITTGGLLRIGASGSDTMFQLYYNNIWHSLLPGYVRPGQIAFGTAAGVASSYQFAYDSVNFNFVFNPFAPGLTNYITSKKNIIYGALDSVTGDGNFVIASNNRIFGTNNFIAGAQFTWIPAGNQFALVGGRNNTIVGSGINYTFITGKSNTVGGQYSAAMGNTGWSYGLASLSVGWQCGAGTPGEANGAPDGTKGLGAFANGLYCQARGRGSHADGWQDTTRGEASYANGYLNTAESFAESRLGMYSTLDVPFSGLIYDPRDPILTVGIGPDGTHRKNALQIFKSGYTKFDTMQNKWGAPMYANPNGSIAPIKDSFFHVTLTGNSIARGYPSGNLAQIFADRIGKRFTTTNTGTDGWCISDMITGYATKVTATYVAGHKNILVGIEGYNSFAACTDTAESYYFKVKQWCLQAKTDGWDVYWMSALPSGIHVERNLPKIKANQMMADSFENYYGIHYINMNTTSLGQFGDNNGNITASHLSSMVRSSEKPALYFASDLTHPTLKGDTILSAIITDNIYQREFGSTIPDRLQYLMPPVTNGTFVTWKKRVLAYDSVMGGITNYQPAGFENCRATSLERIDTSASQICARIEWELANKAYFSLKHTNMDTSVNYADCDYTIVSDDDGNLKFYAFGSLVGTICPWLGGDVISWEIQKDKMRVYKNGQLMYIYTGTTPVFPMRVNFSTAAQGMAFRNMKISRPQDAIKTLMVGGGTTYALSVDVLGNLITVPE